MTLAVIPAYNEAATVAEVVSGVHAAGLAALVVDDGSTDDTAAVAIAAGARVIRLPVNVGVGGALRCGFRWAVQRGHKRVVQVDADLQHDPAAIPALLAAADDSGAELVVGSRFGDGGYPASAWRRFPMWVLARLVSRRIAVPMNDVTSGFRVITEPLLSGFAAQYGSEYLADTVEALLAAHGRGATIVQVPARMGPRREGAGTSRLHAAGHTLRLLLAMAIRPRPKAPRP